MEKEKGYSVYERVVNVIAWICFSLAVIFATATIFSVFTNEKGDRTLFGARLFIVQSDSMSAPKDSEEKIRFNAGDVIIIKPVEDVTALKEGDVIAFISVSKESYGKTVTHKIKEAKYTISGKLIGYVTYGIRTGEVDQTLVQPEYVIGQYAGKVPVVGHFFNFLRTPQGYFTAIGVPCILLIAYFSFKVGGYLNQKDCNKVIQELEDKIKELEDKKPEEKKTEEKKTEEKRPDEKE